MESYDLLISHDIKPSVQRMAIMNYLTCHRTHPTVDEIFKALSPTIPTLSRTTIYNTLKLFAQQGVVQIINIDERNEHFDADMSVHAHFQCKSCGRIYDVPLIARRLPGENDLKKEGHRIDEKQVFFKGICKNCL
jgi:Fe2+ or Zn2+ uptake regulation protein